MVLKPRYIWPLLIFGPACFLIFIATRGCNHSFERLEDYGQIKPYTFTDIRGKVRSSNEFHDKVVIITTLQSTCPYDCAVQLNKINQLLYQHIKNNSRKKLKQVRIISFVTDAKGNPVKDLSNLNETLVREVEDYDPNLWILASGDARKIYTISHNGQTLLEKGAEYYGGEAFLELMLLLDKNHHLRMVLNGSQEGTIRRMRESLALLLKQYDQDRARR
ncbi:MAG: hypothetical protein RL110_1206 [Bacteroidota bacterium]|jgi:cytochrome oxidase Cu insertion factor (SCO1/SenC/PrrC family)